MASAVMEPWGAVGVEEVGEVGEDRHAVRD